MRSLLVLVILIIGMVIITGCTQSGNIKPIQGEEAKTQAENVDLPDYPSPPVDIAVSAQINDKDQTDKTIMVFFSGGRGQKMVKSAWIMMKRSDGTVIRESLKPEVQSEVVLTGTTGEDHVRVYAEYFDGKTYLIGDRTVKMQQRI